MYSACIPVRDRRVPKGRIEDTVDYHLWVTLRERGRPARKRARGPRSGRDGDPACSCYRASPTKLFCSAAIRSVAALGRGPLSTAAAAYSR